MDIEIVAPSFVLVAVTDENLVSRHFVPSLRTSKLVPNPFHILEQHLLTAAIIKFRGPTVGVTGDSLSGFKGAVIFEKICDTGCPE